MRKEEGKINMSFHDCSFLISFCHNIFIIAQQKRGEEKKETKNHFLSYCQICFYWHCLVNRFAIALTANERVFVCEREKEK
jgi:hypothetical protein